MTIVTDNFPDTLLDRIELVGAEERVLGRLGNRLIRLHERDTGPAYLKVGAGMAGKDLLEETDRLEWIGDRLPVPQILYCQTCSDRAFVLSSELPGLPLQKCIEALSMAKAVEKFAQGLKMIHALPTKDCPFDRVLETELAKSERRLQDGSLNIEAFIADTGAEPADVLEELHARALRVEEIVFTHGDYCFPNVLITGDLITGIVDWGIAGISDWHRDFMSACPPNSQFAEIVVRNGSPPFMRRTVQLRSIGSGFTTSGCLIDFSLIMRSLLLGRRPADR